MAAREKAEIEARYVMAIQRPRSIEQFRVQLLAECKRPGFAQVARYSKPMGNTSIEGPSIRFVEAALRHFKNVIPQVTTVYDDDRMRICRVVVADLEANLAYATEIQVAKTVERKGFAGRNGREVEPPKGREVISRRLNSYGEPVFLCVATDDEVITKQNALISKSIRTQGLRLLPGDIVEEAQAAVIATMSKEEIDDPGKAIRTLIDAFAAYKVLPDDLEAWAGKPLDRLQPKDVLELRAIWTAIKDGEITWDTAMSEKNPVGSKEAAESVAQRKLAALEKKSPEPKAGDPAPLTEEEMRKQTEEADAPQRKALNIGRRGQ